MYRYNNKTMKMEKIIVFPYFLLGVFFMMLLSTSRDTKNVSYEDPPMIIETYTGEEPFSFDAFKQFVLDCKLKFPEIVIAQAIQESRFNSVIWRENNNPLGMKVARSRNTTNIGENRGHAKFKNWRMAVLDYAYMQAVFARKIKTSEEYYRYLSHYAEDPLYGDKLRRIIRQHNGFGLKTKL